MTYEKQTYQQQPGLISMYHHGIMDMYYQGEEFVGEGPEENHKSDQSAGTPLL